MQARIFADANFALVLDKSEDAREMSDFAPAAPRRARRMHPVGAVGVVAVHGFLLVLFLLSATQFEIVAPAKPLVVVSLAPIERKPLEPVTPKFQPPPLPEVPVFIAPDIELVTPPPPAQTITVPIAPPQPTPSRTNSGDARNTQESYFGTLLARLNAAKRYPPAARARREEGVVSLRFVINRSGRVLSYNITKSSGSAALDRETTELIQRVQLPPMPPEIDGTQLDLVVPVEFTLH